MLGIDILNLSEFLQELQIQVESATSPDTMDKMAIKIRETIIDRTRTGKDINGAEFQSYSPQYAKKKGSDFVNLTDTGRMLDSIAIEGTGNTRILFFSDRAEVAAKHDQGLDGMPKREFFDFGKTDDENTMLQNFWESMVKENVK